MVEFYRDFDWELDRFVEYRLPIKKQLGAVKTCRGWVVRRVDHCQMVL
jgi:hypothetical protein